MFQNKTTMMQKTISTLIIVFVIQSFTNRNDSFNKYCQYLKLIDLPIVLDCQKSINYPDYSKIPSILTEKFTPLGHKTLGRINLNKNAVSIIQVAQAETEVPMIFNYKIDGTPIDTIWLLSGTCSSDPEYYTHSVCLIGKDKTLKMTDSVIFYKLDKDFNRIPKSDSIIIRNWTCKMDDHGKLIKTLIK
jgi:hypothetical protein